jgi:ketosteroid isomerase-like protein
LRNPLNFGNSGILGPVSQENVDFVKGLFAAGEQLDREAMLAALPAMIPEICDPEIEWVEDPSRADGRVYRGHDGVLESFERWLEDFQEYDMKLEQASDHGDRVFAVAVEHGRGRVSSVEVSSRIYMVMELRDGKILRYQEFYDEAGARAALA